MPSQMLTRYLPLINSTILMSLKGRTIRIIVSEPSNWGENLFGTIISDRGNKILVKLTNTIKGKKLTSDLMELTPEEPFTTFKYLYQFYSVIANGVLLTQNLKDSESIIIGSVTID